MKSIISTLGSWIRKEIKSKIPNMYPPPQPRFYRAAILAQLNSQTAGWIEINGYHAYTSPKIFSPNVVDFNFPTGGVVLKLFANTNTGETRAYVAKWLDIPEEHRVILWAGEE